MTNFKYKGSDFMVKICKNTGNAYIQQEDRGGLYIHRYNSKPPVGQCICGRKFTEDTTSHLYITGVNVYDHICFNSECLAKVIRRHEKHYKEFFVSWCR